MKRVIVLLALLGLAAARIPPARCFTKTTRCCFRFVPCGYALKLDKVTRPCDYKKCQRVCKRACKPVCRSVKVRRARKSCKRVCTWERNAYGIRKRVCKNVVSRRTCKTIYVYVKVEKCKPGCSLQCSIICYRIHAICITLRTIRYPKFCARLTCGTAVITGNNAPPKNYVSSAGKVVKVSKPSRKIISKKPY